MTQTNRKFLGINTNFDSLHYPGFTDMPFKTAISFMDYDAIVIDSSHLAYEYPADYQGTYSGKRLIHKEDSAKMRMDFSRTHEQIVEVLKQGKNVFVLMGKNENCFIYTGKTEYSGTGKNARGTNIVSEYNVFSFLPIEIAPTMVSGDNFNIVCQPPYSTFFQITKDITYYSAYFKAPQKSTLLTIPNSDKAISAVYEYENGKIILLPYPYDKEDFDTATEWKKAGKKYLDALFELDYALSSQADSYIAPLWSDNIKILNEQDEEAKLDKDIQALRKIEGKINKRKQQIETIKKRKILLTASGTPLEEIVKNTLSEIGFTLHQCEVGRSDIIATYHDVDIVAEIKGVSKSAAEKHAAQLEKWVSQFVEEHEHSPKAMLIVNGYCDTPLTERTEAVFPDQMLRYCTAREHVLITTTQLLCLYIEIKNNPSCAEERIKELLSCVGKYQRYSDYQSYLTIIETDNV
ncbi:MAG: hypothetical protein IJB36_01325 [Clostridia bacterium]|nr:hypothetical protein [Clostridia bacterium]